MMETTVEIAANITYSGFAYNTRLTIEYAHTGTFYFLKTSKGKHILSGEESAIEKKAKKKKIYMSSGYYYMKRLAIPSTNAKGEKGIWYINNENDNYSINKVSKYGKKVHAKLSEEKVTVY